jgi:hypothetical protein
MNLQSVEVAVPRGLSLGCVEKRPLVRALQQEVELGYSPLIIRNEANFDKEDKLPISPS